jgi:hypothetical protein
LLEATIDPTTGRIKAELGVGATAKPELQNDMAEGDEEEDE